MSDPAPASDVPLDVLSDVPTLEMRLELVPLAVTDVDVARAWYVERLGFVLDHDVEPGNGMRIVQLTPPGSACSIVLGTADPAGGRAQGLHLVVADVAAVVKVLRVRGVEVGDVVDMGGVKYAHLADPDGNVWALQELPPR